MKKSFLIGIDEAGRGPLAGPVTVAALMIEKRLLRLLPKEARDSKKLSERQRQAWFSKMKEWQKAGKVRFAASSSSSLVIDKRGITRAVSKALSRTLKKLEAKPASAEIKLDGLLSAPKIFSNQRTIIRGDELEPIIALASIVAKVTRDRKMVRLSKKFPLYKFDVHKGYGTAFHAKVIRRHGLSLLHRRTYCKNLV